MPQYVVITSNKSKKKAFWLCVFGGIFGLHFFYVGRRFRGYLTLFTLNFMFLGWVHDLVTISRGRFKDQYGEFLKV